MKTPGFLFDHSFDRELARNDEEPEAPRRSRPSPGKVARTMRLAQQLAQQPYRLDRRVDATTLKDRVVQAKGELRGDDEEVKRIAEYGISEPGRQLPFFGELSAAFTGHDLSGVQAHIGGKAADACEQLGARAYAIGEHVAFREKPDLWLAVHETTHVLQHRRQLPAGDNERQADEMANQATGQRAAQAKPKTHFPQRSEVQLCATSSEDPNCPELDQENCPCPDRYWGTTQIDGLGTRKSKILSKAGGDLLVLAIAMQETQRMTADYEFGDTNTDGTPKQGDASCYGIFKQNWGMISQILNYHSEALAEAYGSVLQLPIGGEIINNNLALDIAILQVSRRVFGSSWLAGHRQGATGLSGGRARDVQNYTNAVHWIRCQLEQNPNLRTNDCRVWVDLYRV